MFFDIQTCVLALICGLCTVIPYLTGNSPVQAAGMFAAGTAVSAVLIAFIRRRGNLRSRIRDSRISRKIGKLSDLQWFLSVVLLILLCWLPAYLALLPGTFGYDAPEQFWRYKEGYDRWSMHHPMLHTWFMGWIIDTGRKLFGTYNYGTGIYTAVQALLSALAVSRSLLFMRRRQIHGVFLLASALWIGWNPYIQVIVFSTTKDVPFAAFFLWFIVEFAEILTDDGQRVGRFGAHISLFVSGYLACMMRNQGIYLLAVALLILLIRDKKRLFSVYGKTAAVVLAVIAAVLGTNTFLTDAVGIRKGDSREMLSVPMNQLARTALSDLEGTADTMTDEEILQLETFLSEEGILSYEADTADPVKLCFDTESFAENLWENIRLYVRVGLRNPGQYLRAFADLVIPYWDMSQNQYKYLSMKYTITDHTGRWGIDRRCKLPGYYNYLFRTVVENRGLGAKAAELLFNPSGGVWLCILLFAWSLMNRNRSAFLIQMLPLLFFLTCLLGPMALLRYLYPLMIAEPLLAGGFLMKAAGTVHRS